LSPSQQKFVISVEPGRQKPGTDLDAEARLRKELTAIFASRTRKEWTDFFIATDIAGAPAFLGADLFDDDHAKARRLLYEEAQPNGTSQRLIGTCIKTKSDKVLHRQQRRRLGSIRKSYSKRWQATTRPELSSFVRRAQSEHRRILLEGK
jgi:crotonobetainyl-CoA:carnitine CoA-transferase CaiB-like acyl-CoA transferase